jgi:dGTPase
MADDPSDSVWRERRSGTLLIRPMSGYRDDFARDRARVIHSAAFRRLQAKTQVLGIGEGDFHRTRLTHSMEAAQISRGLVRAVIAKATGAKPDWRKWLPDPNLIETIALAHDLGHPPFGHGGEIALNYCMRDSGGFEGNGQTIRLLSLLEAHTEDHGLDLTRRTMLGVLKYPVAYERVVRRKLAMAGDPIALRRDDWKPPKCYMATESDCIAWLLAPFDRHDRAAFVALGKKPDKNQHGKAMHKSFDTTFMEIGDDIAYGVHDFEDAVALRLVSLENWQEVAKSIDGAWGRSVGLAPVRKITAALFGDSSHERKRAIGALVNAFIVSVQVAETGSCSHPLLRFQARLSAPARQLLDQLQLLIRNRVIKTPQVQTLEYRGQQIVIRLFEAIASDPPRLLKEGFARVYSSVRDWKEQRRVICDYIAGMTDEYATKMYERLFVPRQGHVFDRL